MNSNTSLALSTATLTTLLAACTVESAGDREIQNIGETPAPLVLALDEANHCLRNDYQALEGGPADVSDKIVVVGVELRQAQPHAEGKIALNEPIEVIWTVRNDASYPIWDAAGAQHFVDNPTDAPVDIYPSERPGFMVLADGISGNAREFASVRFVLPDNGYFAALRDRSPVNWTFASSSQASVAEFGAARAIVGSVEGLYYDELSYRHWIGPGKLGQLRVTLTPLHHASPDPEAGQLYFPNFFQLGGALVHDTSSPDQPAPLLYPDASQPDVETTQLVDVFCDALGRRFAVHGGVSLHLRGDADYVHRPE
jgi:hypothetical protein